MVDSVSAKHAGNYTCIAENAAGIAQHSAELVVIGRKTLGIYVFTIVSSCNAAVFTPDSIS